MTDRIEPAPNASDQTPMGDDLVAAIADDRAAYHCEPADVFQHVRMLAREVCHHRAARTADAERMRAAVREYAIKIIGGYVGAGLSSASTEAAANAIADRAAAQLTGGRDAG